MTDQNFEILIAFLIGAFLFVFGYYKNWIYKKLIVSGIKTEGTIVDIYFSVDSDPDSVANSGTYFPVISYRSRNGGEIIKRYDIGTNPTHFRIGDNVTIFYDAADNETFIIADKRTEYLGPVLEIAGLLVIVFCLIQYLFHPLHIS